MRARRAAPRTSGGAAWLIGVAAIAGVVVTLYRNDVLLTVSRALGREEQFLRVERSYLGTPGPETLRGLNALFAPPEAKAATTAKASTAPPAPTATAARTAATGTTTALPAPAAVEKEAPVATERAAAASPVRAPAAATRPSASTMKSSSPKKESAKASGDDEPTGKGGVPVVNLEEDESPSEKPARKAAKAEPDKAEKAGKAEKAESGGAAPSSLDDAIRNAVMNSGKKKKAAPAESAE